MSNNQFAVSLCAQAQQFLHSWQPAFVRGTGRHHMSVHGIYDLLVPQRHDCCCSTFILLHSI